MWRHTEVCESRNLFLASDTLPEAVDSCFRRNDRRSGRTRSDQKT
ncbi:Uncharacterized protein dnm_017980 [Desulfonema magnum]|uniref:Uncharacterized protein n=1 Tax=Desulfonema magnum TaxID=45655 RepID=A0A975GMF3_9BACT|nr:Uncharacterized protein dnm_017980 [Desulfonema magnum]